MGQAWPVSIWRRSIGGVTATVAPLRRGAAMDGLGGIGQRLYERETVVVSGPIVLQKGSEGDVPIFSGS